MEQPKLKVEFVETESLVPYAKNARVHTKAQVETIVASIQQFGFNDPVGVWNNGDELEIVEGHGRVMAAKELGIERIPIIRLDHLDDDGRRAYSIVHNQTTDNSVFDYKVLDEEIAALSGFDWSDFWLASEDENSEAFGLNDEKYSAVKGEIIYEPHTEQDWSVSDLYELDTTRHDELIAACENKELREMLKLRQAWFCDFKYARIADYYAGQASEREKKAIEALGLVLLDYDGLIEHGFTDIVERY